MITVAVLGGVIATALPKYLKIRRHVRDTEAVHDVAAMPADVTNPNSLDDIVRAGGGTDVGLASGL